MYCSIIIAKISLPHPYTHTYTETTHTRTIVLIVEDESPSSPQSSHIPPASQRFYINNLCIHLSCSILAMCPSHFHFSPLAMLKASLMPLMLRISLSLILSTRCWGIFGPSYVSIPGAFFPVLKSSISFSNNRALSECTFLQAYFLEFI